ncbi:hypothetical protein J6590_003512 [Homalodisca vitripennis]|nr:hypothetical protein J6590_003512 [Homalodisca vitripennis]
MPPVTITFDRKDWQHDSSGVCSKGVVQTAQLPIERQQRNGRRARQDRRQCDVTRMPVVQLSGAETKGATHS